MSVSERATPGAGDSTFGQINIIVAEAGVEYDALVMDVGDADAALGRADVALIIGANDIVNPRVMDDPSSSIYGMPVIKPWLARTAIVMKGGMATGFAGIENPLFFRKNTVMLFGDAKKTGQSLISEVKALDSGH